MNHKKKFTLVILILACLVGGLVCVGRKFELAYRNVSPEKMIIENQVARIPVGQTLWIVDDQGTPISIKNVGEGWAEFKYSQNLPFKVSACNTNCGSELPVYDYQAFTDMDYIYVKIPENSDMFLE